MTRDYMDEWPTPRIAVRLAFAITAVLGLWLAAFNNAIQWEVFFAAYFIVQNVEHAMHRILFELRRSR